MNKFLAATIYKTNDAYLQKYFFLRILTCIPAESFH